MKNTIEALEKSRIKITITLDKAEWDEMNLQAFNKTKGKYSLQGFRKGKVPMKVLENAYGEGVFYDEAINIAFVKYYYDILDANKNIFPVGQPELDIEKIDKDGLTMTAVVPVKPEVTLGDYKGIKFDKIEYNVKDEDVDAEIEKMRNDAGRMVDVDDRAAKEGDTANIDFEGSQNGVKFDGGSAKAYDLVLGSHSFIPGFEEGVIGMTLNEEKVIPVTFPEEYGEKSLAGKAAEFKVKLNSLKVKELPSLDDEFVKDVSEFDTLDALKKDIREKLTKKNEEKADYEIENKIIDKIVENSKMEIPDAMIEGQIDGMVQDFEYRLMYQGLNLDTYLKYMKTTKEDFRKNFTAEAEKSCKAQLVIDKILEVEDVKATDEEIDAELKEMADRANKALDEYKSSMDAEQKAYIERNIVIKKLFALLKKENIIA